jgi:hypothetical protein
MVKVGTGEKYFLMVREKTEPVESGYAVNSLFEELIGDYRTD